MKAKVRTPVELFDSAAAEAAHMAKRAGLIYVSDTTSGYRREGTGKRFRYFFPDNRQLRASAELKRIARLAIPPAYDSVWICMDPRGHLQATGRDARGQAVSIPSRMAEHTR